MIKVKTRNGRDAVVFAYVSAFKNYPVVGIVENKMVDSWSASGDRATGDQYGSDLMLDGVDLSSVTIGPNGELPERTDAALSHAESEMGKMHDEIKALKSALAESERAGEFWRSERDEWKRMYQKNLGNRLERIATAAMQGLQSGDVNRDWDCEALSEFAIRHACALIEALDKEQSK